METATLTGRAPAADLHSVVDRIKADPGYQAFLLLRVGFAVLPIMFGLDKFFGVLVDWEIYLAPWINDIVPGNATDAMHAIGAVEIVVNLLTLSGYYDVALRDFGLMLGALTLGRLASKYDAPGFQIGV